MMTGRCSDTKLMLLRTRERSSTGLLLILPENKINEIMNKCIMDKINAIDISSLLLLQMLVSDMYILLVEHIDHILSLANMGHI